jgi:hypothetical protein
MPVFISEVSAIVTPKIVITADEVIGSGVPTPPW